MATDSHLQRKSDLRRAVRHYLATRPTIAQEAGVIHRHVRRELPCDLDEIEAALTDNRIALEGGGTVRIEVTDMRLLEDDTPDAYHWFAQVNWRALAS